MSYPNLRDFDNDPELEHEIANLEKFTFYSYSVILTFMGIFLVGNLINSLYQ
jgi:hypothetical protein